MHWCLASTEPTTLISALAEKSQIGKQKPPHKIGVQTKTTTAWQTVAPG